MAEQNIIISELDYKVGRLMESYKTSREQKRDLEEEVSRLQRQARALENEVQRLNEEIKTLRVSSAISTGKGGPGARARIGQLAREIDKCIALLNN
ncbi:MAG: hypothetical protein LBF09_00300 [Odoribacteraceae bacterium]|jgi:chromosome segregation ATPase|nr:hypothetical protein [Odoribacteraceae bacterium]